MASQLSDALSQVAATTERAAAILDRIEERHRREDDIERREERFERSMRAVQRDPRRLDFAMMARAVPGLAQQFTELPAKPVPPEFWQLEVDEAVIACPCGVEPHVRIQTISTCECGRMFVFDGDEVRARPPETEEARS